jgi:hypothetical protein
VLETYPSYYLVLLLVSTFAIPPDQIRSYISLACGAVLAVSHFAMADRYSFSLTTFSPRYVWIVLELNRRVKLM